MKWMLCAGLMMCVSVLHAKGLTQAEFDQQLAAYTQTVNHTKKVLEGEHASQDAEVQKKAFCQRLAAYRGIAELAHQNPNLEQAYLMGVIANSYLDRQKQSMHSVGMTEQYFCGDRLKSPVQP